MKIITDDMSTGMHSVIHFKLNISNIGVNDLSAPVFYHNNLCSS